MSTKSVVKSQPDEEDNIHDLKELSTSWDGGDMILVTNESQGQILPFIVQDDHKGIVGSKTLKVPPNGGPKVCYMNIRPMVDKTISAKIRLRILSLFMVIFRLPNPWRFIFNLYGAESVGEYTIPLNVDETDDDLRQQMEIQLKLNAQIIKADWVGSMAAGLKATEKWWKVGMWLIFFAVLMFMVLYWLSGYSLVKS